MGVIRAVTTAHLGDGSRTGTDGGWRNEARWIAGVDIGRSTAFTEEKALRRSSGSILEKALKSVPKIDPQKETKH